MSASFKTFSLQRLILDPTTSIQPGRWTMRIGVGLPAAIPGSPGSDVGRWARKAEGLGFSSVGVIARLVYDTLDPIVALAAAAATTERVELITTVLNIAYRRNALVLAQQLASLDAPAAGRLTDTVTTRHHLEREVDRIADAGCHDVVFLPCAKDPAQIELLARALDAIGLAPAGQDAA